MTLSVTRFLTLSLLALVAPVFVRAVPVEIRLVPFDQTGVNVDKLENERPILNPVSTEKGVEMQQIGIDYTGWGRNILVDGEAVFERYYQGKYIDRLPVGKPDLKAGDHTIWPGGHVFTVAADGSVSTKSPELLVEDGVLKVKCYPVTLRAYIANPDEAGLPMTMRTAPLPNLTLRDAADAAQPGKGGVKELLPVFEKFAPLTLWLPANTSGKGYLVHPVGLTFHLDGSGVVAADTIKGLHTEKNLIEIPLYGFPIVGDANTRAVVTGVDQYEWRSHQPGAIRQLLIYPRAEPFEFLITQPGPSFALSTADFPYKSFRVDVPDAAIGAQRAVVAELAERHFQPGGTINARIRAIDGTPAHNANRDMNQASQALGLANRALQAAKKTDADAEKALKAMEAAKPAGSDEVDPAQTAAAEKLAAAVSARKESAAALAEAEKTVESTTAARNEAVARVATQSLLNPMAKATPYAELQTYGGGTWLTLDHKPGADGAVAITLPGDLTTGVYRLRLGVRSGEVAGKSLFTEQWVSVVKPQSSGLGLFSPRGRDAFYRGESFWLGLTLRTKQPVAAGEAIEVDLIDEAGTRLSLLRDKAGAVDQRQTFIVRLDGVQTLSLAAGHYRVEAKLGKRTAAPLSFDLVEPEPLTHFTTLLNGKYNVLGGSNNSFGYSGVIKSGVGAESLVSEITSMGYNTFMGMSYDFSRVHRHGLDLEQVVREIPELGPWDSYYQSSGRDRVLNAAVRRNMAFYENLFTYNDSMLPRDPHILDACERFSSLEAASMRFSPAFRGVCLYDEIYESSDNSAPRSVVAAFFNAQELRYRAKYPGMTSSDANKALDRFTGRPAGQRNYEDLEKFRTWPALRDTDWELFTTRMSAAVKQAAPGSKNWTQYRAMGSSGGNLEGMGQPEQVFKNLDMAATVMYKDGGSGDRPVFAPMLADIMRFRDDLPVWTQIHNYHASGLFGGHLLRQTFFGLSQKLDGLSFFTIEVSPEDPDPLDNRDTIRDISEKLLTPYGDFFTSLDRGYRKVAVFYSRESAYLGERKPNNLSYTAEGLWVACIRAGFPADFLYDNHIRAGKGLDYDVIFAPGYYYEDEASPEILAALKRLVAAGKTVVVEKSSKLPIEGIVRLDSDLDEYDDKLGGAFPRYVDFETSMVWDRTEKTTKLLKEFLIKKTKPAAIHDLIVGPDWLRSGKGEYMVLPNWAPTGFSGLNRTYYQAPSIAKLRFPVRPAFAYDVLEMRPVDVKTDGDWMTLNADMRSIPGKVYAFLPSAIDKVALKTTAKLAAGTDLSFQASVANASGEMIDAAFPLEITILDAAGRERLHVYRSAKPSFEMAWRVPANLAPGAWKLRVRELISGTVGEARIDVAAPAVPVAASLDTRPVWAHDPDRIHEFVTGKGLPADAPAIVIAIDAEQPWTRPHAEKLAATLKARGRDVRIADVVEVIRIPNDWGQIPVLDGGRIWRGQLVDPGIFVDAPLILLGRRYENRLSEALIRRDVFPEVITANFPASGKAVINWTRRAFSVDYDTISIMANDDAGLAAGIAALPDVSGPPETGALTRATFTAPTQSVAAVAVSKEPTTLRDVLSAEDRVRSVDVDPATGRVVVGTFGYGHNLFCFDAAGKLLWKQFLPEHNVYFTSWIDDGKRIAAATGKGALMFIVNAADGSVTKKFAASERSRFHESYGLPNLEGSKNTELQIELNPTLRQIIVRGITGIMAFDYDGKKQWFIDHARDIAAYPEEAEQSAAASFYPSFYVGPFAISPDGTRIVVSEEKISGSTPGEKPGTKDDIWRHMPKIIDARTGKVLAENNDDPGNYRSSGQWNIVWPASSKDPLIITAGVSAPLHADGSLGEFKPYDEQGRRGLKDGGYLVTGPKTVARHAADGKLLWSIDGERIWLPQLDTLNDAQTRFYRSDREGLVRAIDFATGKTLWDFKQPFFSVLDANGDELVAGANNGAVVRLDAAGKPVWQTLLRKHHELPGSDYPAYVKAALQRDADSTEEFFPAGSDKPGDYDGILRMGIEQLANGDFEDPAGWTTEKLLVNLGAPAKSGQLALQLAAGQLVTQRLSGRVIPSATYLLEFWYRAEDSSARLAAGALLDGAKQTFTGSEFSGRAGEWTFGRLAIKSMVDTKTLDIGFEATGGLIQVDAASLRAVRFPSANLLANAELHELDQTYVEDIRVQYERIPAQLRERLMSRNRTSAFAQGITSTAMIYTQEAAFLQNGKLDDVGAWWTNAPDPMAFSVTLTKPSYISHLVIYLNNATPENVYPMISILADNLETKTPQSVGLVRMNHRRFIVVHFDEPLFTDALKIIPSFYSAHTDSMTEIEVYGPLDGGKLADAGAADPDAVPMLMGNISRVIENLPTDLTGTWEPFDSNYRSAKYPPFSSGGTVVDGLFSISDPSGMVRSVYVPDPADFPPQGNRPNPNATRLQNGTNWNLATVTPTTTPARYRGRLLVGSADYKLHAVADNGTYLWSFATGGRIYSSPAPQGDDVFFGSDDHRIYKVDADSGILIWEFVTGDKVRGAPALAGGKVFAVSWDGNLYALDAETGAFAWKAPVAKFTRSTPAVHDGKIYLGDEDGNMRAFDAATGRELWSHPLFGYISTAPVVTPDGVTFATEQGAVSMRGFDGTSKWTLPAGVAVTGQIMPTKTQLLVPTEKGLQVLLRADGKPDTRFAGPESNEKVLSVLKWRDELFVHTGFAWTDRRWGPRTYAEFENTTAILVPAGTAEKEAAK